MSQLVPEPMNDDVEIGISNGGGAGGDDYDDEGLHGKNEDEVCSVTGSESVASDGHHDDDDNAADNVISKGEYRAVWFLKLVVLLVLFGSATGVAMSIHSYIARTEETRFKDGFKDDAAKVLESIGSSMEKALGAFDATATSFVSHARATDQEWPFVTIPEFAERMSRVLPMTEALNINLLPIVKPEQRTQWEAYSVENDGWVNEGMAAQEEWEGYHGPVVYNGTKYGTIHGDFGEIERNLSRVLLPTWQNFPVIPNTTYVYNFDWLSVSFSESYEECISTHQTIVGQPYLIPKPGDKVAEAETAYWADYFRDNFLASSEEALEPVSDILYPILDKVRVADKDSPIIAVLAVSFYWRNMIRGILPRGSDGMHVVVKNPCTSAFSYEIQGEESVYLGAGDNHSKAYDDQVLNSTLAGLIGMAKYGPVYSGAKLSDDLCPISIFIYPSDTVKAAYTTNNRFYFTISTVLIFLFATLMFYMYDRRVEKRQHTTMATAYRATAIVSSLFPSAVRDRLNPATVGVAETPPNSHRFSAMERRWSLQSVSFESASPSGPIAELYPDTTVLFADIAGFTSWSSRRTPTEVFQLLETLYAAFDEIAKHRGIFKVETIGDCYVAAVGLPTPRKHHAVAMARFASDCIQRMSIVTKKLEAVLGPDTVALSLRVGLNSGPTTAGVLRGQKSRFQLFGDTVNTAARMESTGERNHIQVSQATADLIRRAGHRDWLSKRSEEVNVKGKGLMTTYWCDPR